MVFVESPPGRLSEATAERLREVLCAHRVVTHNGVGFDFRVLANHLRNSSAADTQKRRELVHCCASSYDLCLDHFTSAGYPVSMQSFLDGCELSSKTWSGAESAKEWEENMDRVIEYCTSDTVALQNLVRYVEKHNFLKRKTKKGNVVKWVPFLVKPMRTAKECLAMHRASAVDTSWMTDPLDPADAFSWIPAAIQPHLAD